MRHGLIAFGAIKNVLPKAIISQDKIALRDGDLNHLKLQGRLRTDIIPGLTE